MVEEIGWRAFPWLLFWFFLAGCQSSGAPQWDSIQSQELIPDVPREVETPAPDFSMELSDGALVVMEGGRRLFALRSVEARVFEPQVTMLFGFFDFLRGEEVVEQLTPVASGEGFKLEGETLTGEVVPEVDLAGNFRVTVRLSKPVTAIRLLFDNEPGARFWGFGEQYNRVDLAGWRVPVWVQEQGVGRAEAPEAVFQGTYTDSYFPQPYFMDPEVGKGFLLQGSSYAEFDLGRENADVWWVESWGGQELSFVVLPGPTPLGVVEQLTLETGRLARRLPGWAFSGVWLAAQGGTSAVSSRVETALAAGIPLSAVWVQDWVGARDFGGNNFGVKYHWTADEELYPELAELIASLKTQGIRFLGYFNPFVVETYDQYEQGAASGYLVKDPQGRVYSFPITTFEGALLDVTNPEAVGWFQDYARQALDLGMAGWMADFGEWLPFDARLHDGEAPQSHNRYPELWHKANLEVLEEANPDGEFVLLTRSGYSGEQRVAQVVWAGDQEADWSEGDGFPTVVTAGLNSGLSGVSVFTHDIGGFSGGPTTKELFWRWTELGAFTPVMRTHDGLKKSENYQFDSDKESLAHFARFARIHEAMAPIWETLQADAVGRGWPMIRHTALVFPDWKPALEAHHQWMLGNEILVVPVLEPGVSRVSVVLPLGAWVHLFTGQLLEGGGTVDVEAPLGQPCVLLRDGAYPDLLAFVAQEMALD